LKLIFLAVLINIAVEMVEITAIKAVIFGYPSKDIDRLLYGPLTKVISVNNTAVIQSSIAACHKNDVDRRRAATRYHNVCLGYCSRIDRGAITYRTPLHSAKCILVSHFYLDLIAYGRPI